MPRIPTPGAREQKATIDLLEALGSSLDIKLVLQSAYPLLLQLVPADYGALGISSSGRPEDYEWTVAALPPAFFATYPEMAPHDFVRASVTRKLNVVLRDEEMVPRAEIESNMMYRRAREIGAPIEQVMAVMLHVDERWQSGLSLYRASRVPFSDRERAALQRVTRSLADAVRRCHLFAEAEGRAAGLDAMLGERGDCALFFAPPAVEVSRTPGASALIDRWFAPHERRAGRAPQLLLDLVARASREESAPPAWTRQGPDATLEASIVPLSACAGRARWMVLLQERSLPRAWRAVLTPRQQEVTLAVLRGWDNRLIAEELGCEPATVTKHLQSIFDKLGVSSRAALIARAARDRG